MKGPNVLENRILGQEEIEQIIPHRGRWLLLDKIVEIQEKSIVAVKIFREEECEGHFKMVPGHLICEALAQAGAALVLYHHHLREKIIFLVRSEAKFLFPVRPEERVTLEVNIVKLKMGMCFFVGTASIGLKRAVEWQGVGTLGNSARDAS